MTFGLNERLYRAVLPSDMYWKKDGKISSAVFKDSKGLSCDRDLGRVDSSLCVSTLLNYLQRDRTVVSISYSECIEVNTLVEYDPIPDNCYHSLILNDNEKIQLTEGKARRLTKMVRYDYLDSYAKNKCVTD